MAYRTECKRAVFGVSPRKVSSYLRQLKHLQARRLAELQEQVEEQRAEQVRLKKELDELAARHRAKQDALQHRDLLINRTQQAIQAMQAGTQQEVAELQRQIEQKQLKHRQKIAWIEQETESYNQALQSLLQEFGAKMQKFNSSAFDMLESYEQAQIVQAQAEAQAHAQEVGQQEVAAQQEALHPQEALHQQEAVSEKVVPLPVKAQADPVTRLRSGTNDWVGSDNDMPGRKEMASATASPVIPTVAPVSKPQLVHDAGSAFWGNIQQFVSSGYHEMEDVTFTSSQAGYEASYELEPTTPAQTAGLQQETPMQPSSPDAWLGESYEAGEFGEGGETKESEAVSTEIMSIRNRYIVGKLAGLDLYDHTGNRIVAAGETISAEVVAMAERSGKLPDLIVNMKIPGVSTEK